MKKKDEHGIVRKYTHSFAGIPADRWEKAGRQHKEQMRAMREDWPAGLVALGMAPPRRR